MEARLYGRNAEHTSAAVSTNLSSKSKTSSGVLYKSVNECLFNQTDRVLHDITLFADESCESAESGPLSDIDQSQQEIDEGFVEEDDQTVASVDALLP